jgi:phosphate transport system permease protein
MKFKYRMETRIAFDYLFFGAVICLSLLILIPLILILGNLAIKGASALNWHFFTALPGAIGNNDGGISNAIVGSFIIVGMASLISIPMGIGTGIFLYEYRKLKISHLIRITADVLQGIPSIVIGILAYTWVVLPTGGFSAFAGSFALSIMMLPAIIRTTEETLLRIPDTYKEASLAMGVPYFRTMFSVILPIAMRGILTGVMLSFSRVLGETAPLLFTTFGNAFMVLNPAKPMAAIPLVIYNYAMSAYDEWQQLAWGASFLLVLIVLAINLLTKVLSSNETFDY